MARLKAILWDLGHTLVDWSPKRLYSKLIHNDDAVEDFLGGICTMAWHTLHDAGVSMAENRKALIAAHPDKADLIKAWETRWDDMFDGPVGQMDEVFMTAHQTGLRQYAISNLPAEKWPPLKVMYPWLNLLDDAVISGEEKVIKPDREIYRITIDRMNTAPEDTLFIDDRLENIEAARPFGFQTHHFTSEARVREHLRGLGLTV